MVTLRELGALRITDGEGTFRFDGVRAGRYALTVRHVGHVSIERLMAWNGTDGDSVSFAMTPAMFRTEEIIVRSTRGGSIGGASPYAATALTEDHLNQGGTLTVPELLGTVPGVAVVRDGSWETGLSIRGLSRANVVALIDNVRLETAQDIAGPLSLVNVHDLDRVEIVKSSGSVLFGTGALGGIVHYQTKRPSFSPQTSTHVDLVADAATVNRQVGGYVAVEERASSYAFRLSGGMRHAANTQTPAGILPNSAFKDFSVDCSLGIKTVGEQSMHLTFQQVQAEDAGIPGGAPIAVSATATYTLARRRLMELEYVIPQFWTDLSLLSFRVSRQDVDRNVEIQQTPTLTLTPHAVHATVSGAVEARLLFSTTHAITAGVEAWQRTLDSRRERIDMLHDQLTEERPLPFATFLDIGGFLQDECSVVPDKVTITIGGRFDGIRVHSGATLNPEYVVSGGVLNSSPTGQRLLWNEMNAHNSSWSGSLGIDYSVSPNVDLTFLAATGFRSPSIEERFQFLDLGSAVYLGNPDLSPERSFATNLGGRFKSGRAQISVDLFINDLRNLVVAMPGTFEGRTAYVSTNVGTARLWGGEVSAEGIFTPWLLLRASCAVVHGEDLFQHTNLPQIPPLNGEVAITTSIPAVGLFSIFCNFASAQNDVAAGESSTAGYALLGLDADGVPIELMGTHLLLRGAVHNLFNREYVNHLSTLRGVLHFEPGRNVTISATLSF